MKTCDIYDKNGEIRETLTECKIPYTYQLEFPIEIKDNKGELRESIDEVLITSRLTFGMQKKIMIMKDDGAKTEAMVLSLTNLNSVQLQQLDGIDFENLSEIFSVFFQSGRNKADISG